jgi:hypothetical protein
MSERNNTVWPCARTVPRATSAQPSKTWCSHTEGTRPRTSKTQGALEDSDLAWTDVALVAPCWCKRRVYSSSWIDAVLAAYVPSWVDRLPAVLGNFIATRRTPLRQGSPNWPPRLRQMTGVTTPAPRELVISATAKAAAASGTAAGNAQVTRAQWLYDQRLAGSGDSSK